MVIPSVIGIGAAKAGTTTLHDILVGHPDVHMPAHKETHFFDDDSLYANGMDWYGRDAFAGYGGQRVVAEITPCYMYFEEVPGRIARDIGTHARLFAILRHPVDRAYSHYIMNVSRGNEDLSFADAIAAESDRMRQGYVPARQLSYMGRGFYARQLSRFLRYFPREQLHVMLFEEFIEHKRNHIDRLLQFIGVERADELDVEKRSNARGGLKSEFLNHLIMHSKPARRFARSLVRSHATRQTLRRAIRRWNYQEAPLPELESDERQRLLETWFRDDIGQLEEMLGRDLSLWDDPV